MHALKAAFECNNRLLRSNVEGLPTYTVAQKRATILTDSNFVTRPPSLTSFGT